MQRLCYLSSTNAYLYGGFIRLMYLLFPVIIMVAAPFVNDDGDSYFLSYGSAALPFFALSIVVTYLYSKRTFHPLYSEQYNIANILACLLALKGIFRVQKKFQVSIKRKRSRENSFAFVFIVLVSAVMVTAEVFLVFYWAIVARGSSGGWPSSALVLALFWNTYNLVFVLSLLRFLRRFNQRPSLPFPFHPPSTRVHFSTGDVGRLRCVSLQGAIISSRGPLAGDIVRARFATRSGPIAISGNVTGRDRHRGASWIRVDFDEATIAQRRQLTHFFFDEVNTHHYAHDVVTRSPRVAHGVTWVSRLTRQTKAGSSRASVTSSSPVGKTKPSRLG